MKPLAEPFLSGATELIHLKSDLIAKLSRSIENYRPLHRLNKTLKIDNQYALIMDDLCTIPNRLTMYLKPDDLIGPTISIEIKPKQGFLPVHRSLMRSSSNEQAGFKLRDSCLYGSHQYLKLMKGRIERRSDYCPINLFSGCPIRMRYALDELIKNPQNNLRVFKDRELAYGDNKRCKFSNIFENFFEPQNLRQHQQTNNEERLIDLLIQCLLNDNENKNNNELVIANSEDENFCHSSDICLQHPLKIRCKRCDLIPHPKKHKSSGPSQSHRLPRMCVLSSVLRAQKLDSIGAFEALFMLEWLLEHSKLDQPTDVIEELSKAQIPDGFGSSHQLPFESQRQYYFRKVWEFLVSLTAKDCSIMVTLRRVASDRHESLISKQPNHLLRDTRTGTYYLFNVGIADLDQKKPLKIAKICDNLNSILHVTSDNVNSKRFCQSPVNKSS